MDLDVTLIAQFAIIITAMLVLGPLLFNPMLQVLELREKSITGARQDSQKLLADTSAKEQALREKLETARRGALAERPGEQDEKVAMRGPFAEIENPVAACQLGLEDRLQRRGHGDRTLRFRQYSPPVPEPTERPPAGATLIAPPLPSEAPMTE